MRKFLTVFLLSTITILGCGQLTHHSGVAIGTNGTPIDSAKVVGNIFIFYIGGNMYSSVLSGETSIYSTITITPQSATPTAVEGKIYYDSDDDILRVYNGITWDTLNVVGAGGGTSGVTSVASGNGMSFTTITGIGTITLGTPSTLTLLTTNGLTTTSHTHALSIASVDSAVSGLAPAHGGVGASYYLNAGGTWTVPGGSGDVSKVGTPLNDQVGVWTGSGTIEGTTGLTYSGTSLSVTGSITNASWAGGVIGASYGGTGLTSISTLLNSNTTKANVGLSAVENTALSTWAGTTAITTLGTITAGTWTAGTIGALYGGTGLTSISTLLNSNTTKTQVGLSLVENTALSTWAGNAYISSVDTIISGVWQGTDIATGYVADALTGKSINGVTLTTGGSTSSFLNANGAYSVPSGAGNVSKVGTPLNDQIGVWTGDGLIEGTTGLTFSGTILNLSGNITLTGTVDGIDVYNEMTTNNAKVTNATHSGDVTGATTLTIANGAVDIIHHSATGTPGATTYLRGDNTWSIPSGGTGLTEAQVAALVEDSINAVLANGELGVAVIDSVGTGPGTYITGADGAAMQTQLNAKVDLADSVNAAAGAYMTRYDGVTGLALKANIASPTFTGTVYIDTATVYLDVTGTGASRDMTFTSPAAGTVALNDLAQSAGADTVARAILQDSLVDYHVTGYYFIAASNATAKEKAIANAQCDGTADQVEIIAALTAGYNVKLSSGTFTIAALITASVSNVEIVGSGKNKTTITVVNGAGIRVMTIGGSNWVIRDLNINGNKANNTGSYVCGIYAAAQRDWLIDNCEIEQMDDQAIYIRGAAYNGIIRNCYIHDNGEGVIGYRLGDGGVAPHNILIEACVFDDMTAESHVWFSAGDSPYPYGITVNNCTFLGTTGYHGVYYSEIVTDCNVYNSYFDLDEGIGVASPSAIRYYHGAGGTVSGNRIAGVGNGDGVTGIHLLGAHNVVIDGNYMTSTNGGLASGIALEATEDNYDIYDVVISNNVMYNVSNASSQTFGIELHAALGYRIERVNISDNTIRDDRGASAWNAWGIASTITTAGIIRDVIISNNIIEGVLSEGISMGANISNISINNNTIIDVPIGINFNDGDTIMVMGNRLVDCPSPIDLNDADVSGVVVSNNNWFGCTNDITYAAATNVKLSNNISKTGVWNVLDDSYVKIATDSARIDATEDSIAILGGLIDAIETTTLDTVIYTDYTFAISDTTLFYGFGAGGGLAGDTALFLSTLDQVHGHRKVYEDSLQLGKIETYLSAGDTLRFSLVYGDTIFDSDGTLVTIAAAGGVTNTTSFTIDTVSEPNYIWIDVLSVVAGRKPIVFRCDLYGYIKRN